MKALRVILSALTTFLLVPFIYYAPIETPIWLIGIMSLLIIGTSLVVYMFLGIVVMYYEEIKCK